MGDAGKSQAHQASWMLLQIPSLATGQAITLGSGDHHLASAFKAPSGCFSPENKHVFVSVAMLRWRGAIYSGLCKQFLASQWGSLQALSVLKSSRFTGWEEPALKPFASQPRSPAEGSAQASSSIQSSAPAPNRKQMPPRQKFKSGTLGLETPKRGSSTPWVGTAASFSLGTPNGDGNCSIYSSIFPTSMSGSPQAFAASCSGAMLRTLRTAA